VQVEPQEEEKGHDEPDEKRQVGACHVCEPRVES
jgi:hypothetical protein